MIHDAPRQVMSGAAAVEQQHKDWNSDDEDPRGTGARSNPGMMVFYLSSLIYKLRKG